MARGGRDGGTICEPGFPGVGIDVAFGADCVAARFGADCFAARFATVEARDGNVLPCCLRWGRWDPDTGRMTEDLDIHDYLFRHSMNGIE